MVPIIPYFRMIYGNRKVPTMGNYVHKSQENDRWKRTLKTH